MSKASSRMSETEKTKLVRCAIYTRKSSEEGLALEFNSLDAQRDSCESYIESQKSKGWVCLPEKYDDGGISGGHMERPALKRLLADIEAGKIDSVVVYKLDRLSRSLVDFTKMIEVFDRHGVAFVSATQAFNTADSMGRLMMNVLLSFAQFERELVSERTRDKIAGARRKGKWAGGRPVLGYDLVPGPGGSKLHVNESEAERVRRVFELYLEDGSLMPVVRECRKRGWTTKAWTSKKDKPQGGAALDKGTVYAMLTNVVYVGKVRHHEEIFEGEHDAIVDQGLFDRVQAQLKLNGRTSGSRVGNKHGALLKGLVRCTACGCGMGHHYVSKAGGSGKARRYQYYVCGKAQKLGWDTCPAPSLPATDLERIVIDEIRAVAGEDETLRAVVSHAMEVLIENADARQAERPRLAARLEAAADPNEAERLTTQLRSLDRRIARDEQKLIDPDELVGAAEAFDPVWDALTPSERADLVREMVAGVEWDAATESVHVHFHADELEEAAA
ncbi:MAG: site-specific DNA recombinase [Phycisphaerales bacterium]|jgi:site-specific DNA recombinase